jgi:hypothetical protein
MHNIEQLVRTFKQVMDMPNKIWGPTGADFIERVARRLENESVVRQDYADVHAPDLRRLAALLRKMQITLEGGAPIDVVCQECKMLYDAKPGGEPYPEGKRVSHGICKGCLIIKEHHKAEKGEG